MPHKIMVIGGNLTIGDTLGLLVRSGFSVIRAATLQEAISLSREEKPHLFIVDTGSVDQKAWGHAYLAQGMSKTPLILVSPASKDATRIEALETIADDFITMPFNPRELVARVRAVLRRTHFCNGIQSGMVQVGELRLNAQTREASCEQDRLRLTPAEFDLLSLLMSQPGRVFTRSELLDGLKGHTRATYERVVDVHVKNLRAKLCDDPHLPTYIETVYGVGYRLMREGQ
jgi:DNA-binding response OmpR family regulator